MYGFLSLGCKYNTLFTAGFYATRVRSFWGCQKVQIANTTMSSVLGISFLTTRNLVQALDVYL